MFLYFYLKVLKSPNFFILIERWKTYLDVTKGPILRGLYKDGSASTNPLKRASMRQILYGLQNAAGIEGENFSSHSFRVGGALD